MRREWLLPIYDLPSCGRIADYDLPLPAQKSRRSRLMTCDGPTPYHARNNTTRASSPVMVTLLHVPQATSNCAPRIWQHTILFCPSRTPSSDHTEIAKAAPTATFTSYYPPATPRSSLTRVTNTNWTTTTPFMPRSVATKLDLHPILTAYFPLSFSPNLVSLAKTLIVNYPVRWSPGLPPPHTHSSGVSASSPA